MFGLGLIRFVPVRLRPLIIRSVGRARATIAALRFRVENRRTPGNFPPDSPIALIGLFASPTGIGQGARLMWHDLHQRGHEVVAIDVTRSLGLPGGPRPEGILDEAALKEMRPGRIVVHLNPPLYAQMYLRMPYKLRRRSWLIGYWAWELEQIPQDWLASATFADEVWVPSDFVADAIRRRLCPRTHKQVKVVPHAVDAMPFGPRKTRESLAAARARHGLPADALIVGYSFAMSSNYTRKNPLAAIAAFRRAFPPEKRDARLILRCNDSETWPPGFAELTAAAKEDPRIILMDSETRRMPIKDFYEAIDVYLSPHRSEGYGLNLAEAASLGSQVLATGWGLAADIAARPEVTTIAWRLVPVNDPQKIYTEPGARWAEPDIADAAAKLSVLAEG